MMNVDWKKISSLIRALPTPVSVQQPGMLPCVCNRGGAEELGDRTSDTARRPLMAGRRRILRYDRSGSRARSSWEPERNGWTSPKRYQPTRLSNLLLRHVIRADDVDLTYLVRSSPATVREGVAIPRGRTCAGVPWRGSGCSTVRLKAVGHRHAELGAPQSSRLEERFDSSGHERVLDTSRPNAVSLSPLKTPASSSR
jgi:hypothetical protein